MSLQAIQPSVVQTTPSNVVPLQQLKASGQPPTSRFDQAKLRSTFDQFVGETFYGQMLKALRTPLNKPAYFHGGQAEEIFQGQLDQVLVEQVSKANAAQFTDPMYELFVLSRK